MKRIFLFIFFIFLFGILSCSKKSNLVGNSVRIIIARDIIGQWQIVHYADSGIDKTNQFASINIQFNIDQSLTVSRHDTVYSGSWAIEPSDGLDKVDIIISTWAIPYSILQETWFVSGKTTATLSFYHMNGSAKKTIELGRK